MVGELAVGPEVGLVLQHVARRRRGPGARPRAPAPSAGDVALLEERQRLGVVGRRDVHVAAARGVGLVALVIEPDAQRDILRVAELRCREGRAREIVGVDDVVADDERGSAGRGTGDDARRLAADWMKVLIDGFGPM